MICVQQVTAICVQQIVVVPDLGALAQLPEPHLGVLEAMCNMESAHVALTPRGIAAELGWDVRVVRRICQDLIRLGAIAEYSPDESSGPRALPNKSKG